MAFDHAGPGVLNVFDGTAPPGWEPSIKKMKKSGEVENPWALAWHMRKKGMEPGGKSEAAAKGMMKEVDGVCLAASRGEAWAQSQFLANDLGGPRIYQEMPW